MTTTIFTASTSSTRPASPTVGQVTFDTNLQTTLFWNGTAWETMYGNAPKSGLNVQYDLGYNQALELIDNVYPWAGPNGGGHSVLNTGSKLIAVGQYCQFSSTDGKTWTPMPHSKGCGFNTNTYNRIWAGIASNGTNIIKHGYTGSAAISTDGGNTFSIISPSGLNSGSTSAVIYSMAFNGNTVVAGMQTSFASISTDGGNTWSALTQGLNSGTTTGSITGLDVDTATGTWVAVFSTGHAAISTNNGSTWSALTAGLNSGSTSATWTTVRYIGSSTWMAVSNSGYAAISTNDGSTWAAMTKGLGSGVASTNFTDLQVFGSTIVAIGYSGSTTTACYSTNNGTSWTAINGFNNCLVGVGTSTLTGQQTLGFSQPIAIRQIGGNYVVLSFSGSVWSPDLVNWYSSQHMYGWMPSIVDNANQGSVYSSGSRIIRFGTSSSNPAANVFAKSDDGFTYQPLPSSNNLNASPPAASSYGPSIKGYGNTIVASATYQLMISTDNGNNWFRTQVPLSSSLAMTTVSLPDISSSGRIIVGGNNGYIAYSDNNGLTWTQGTTIGSTTIGVINWVSGNTWLATTATGVVYQNTNNGVGAWTSVYTASGSPNPTAFGKNGANLMMAFSSGLVVASSNSGASWSTVTPPLQTNEKINDICGDGGSLMLLAGSFGTFCYSTNNGTSWTTLPVSAGFNAPQYRAIQRIVRHNGNWSIHLPGFTGVYFIGDITTLTEP